MRQPFPRYKEEITIPRQIDTERTTYRRKSKTAGRRLVTVGCIAVGLLVILVLALLLIPGRQQPQPDVTQVQQPTEPTPAPEARIASGVTIAGIPVGGMTEQEALAAVGASVVDIYQTESMTVTVDNRSFTLSPAVTMAHLDAEAAVRAALDRGASSDSLALSLDRAAIQDALTGFYNELGGVYTPSGYWLEGDAPNVALKEGDCQTLVLNRGSAGHLVDLQDALDRVLAGYEAQNFQVTLNSPGEEREPVPLDLEAVYQQVTVPAQNPRVDSQTLEVIPGTDGYGFDVDQATALLDAAPAGQTVRISMEYISPTVSEEDAWFQDTLGYCKTEYTDNENRNENLRLACEKLNGIILQPGQTLSYNETLGKRTREAGYLPAPAYSGTELVDELGGGICQVSSTLYLSSLFAELTVVERRNHGYPASYIPLGLDATVNWGTTDLKLRNDYELPVKILAEVSDGFVKVWIMGVEQRDYYVKMEYRVDDHPSYAAAYRCRYDRETDEEISRVLDHTSIYLEDVWCNPGYAESDTDEP